MTEPLSALLERLAAGRGYLLVHHRYLAAHAPRALAAYDALYRDLSLEPGALSPPELERVWLALLAVHRKFSWRIHHERAVRAGLSEQDVLDCVSLAAFAAGHDAWDFALADWNVLEHAAIERRMASSFDAARGAIAAPLAHAIVATCAAIAGRPATIAWHAPRAVAAGLGRDRMAHALALVLLECGVNSLIEALEAWESGAVAGLPGPLADEATT